MTIKKAPRKRLIRRGRKRTIKTITPRKRVIKKKKKYEK